MIEDCQKFVATVLEIGLKETFSEIRMGFEKESLRVIDSTISQFDHPKGLGSSLCNEYITTDFSEAQLELITPPLKGSRNSIESLDEIHHFVSSNINNEILWPLSMPPLISSEDEIPIARYGTSNLSMFKSIYRNGLAIRYGKTMQAISGFHFNYSLPEKIWQSVLGDKPEVIVKTKSEVYFNMIRNIFRMNWVIIYLFGASPLLTNNFLKKRNNQFEKLDKDSMYLPYATSLRMSDFGYCNSGRRKTFVSLDSLDNYVSDLRKATNTIDNRFNVFKNKLEIQLNSNILQIEDEYYAVVRAKSNTLKHRRASANLLESGVDFIEIRSLDLDPFSRTGIDIETILFFEVFLIYCFSRVSGFIDADEVSIINENDLSVSKFGRQPNLMLKEKNRKIYLKDWGLKILSNMLPIAEELDTEGSAYVDMIHSMKLRMNDPSKTLSGILIKKLISEKMNYSDFGSSVGKSNKDYYLGIERSSNKQWNNLEHTAAESLQEQLMLEKETIESGTTFEEYKADYFKN